MKRCDRAFIAVLALLAVFIWVRNSSWASTAADVLPILSAIPVFYWLGAPWSFRRDPPQFSKRLIGAAIALLVLGVVSDLTWLLALGWTMLLWAWLSARVVPAHLPQTKKLLVLPCLAFPWVTLDAQPIGWAFRLSGAWVTQQISAWCGYDAVRHGTQLWLNGYPISVEAACSGLNTLQSMLIAGSALAFALLGHRARYWWNLPFLVALAWVANTTRILALSWAAVSISPDFAHGQLHQWSGWAVLFLMFCLCWIVFALQSNDERSAPPRVECEAYGRKQTLLTRPPSGA